MLAKHARIASRAKSRKSRLTKILVVATLLLAPVGALAASPEDDYLAARDRYIAAFKKIESGKGDHDKALEAEEDKASKDLLPRLEAIVGPFAVAGFPTKAELNTGLEPQTEGFGTLDGLAYGLVEGGSDTGAGGAGRNVVVTTDSLLNKWLIGHQKWWDKGNPHVDAAAAVKTEAFYTQAINTDAAIVHFTELPVVAPPGAKFAHATLSARTQDELPNTPIEIFVALEQNGRVFIVNETLTTPMAAITACDAIAATYQKNIDAANKAYADGGRKSTKLADETDKLTTKLGDERDAALHACFADKVKDMPGFKEATAQAAAIVAALTGK